MYPFYLFWNYLSPFPWYVGTCLMTIGLSMLWSTRFTAKFYPRLGKRYLIFSSIVRPLAVIILGWSWLEIFSVQPPVPIPVFLSKSIIVIFIICVLLVGIFDSFLRPFIAFLIAPAFLLYYTTTASIIFMILGGMTLAYEIWALKTLGFRRSFLYALAEDPLITAGPYKYQRHPQLFASLLLIIWPWFSFANGYLNNSIPAFQVIIFLLYACGVGLITISEEKDLTKRLGSEYEGYKKKIPGFVGFGPSSRTFGWVKSLMILVLVFFCTFPISCGYFIYLTESDSNDDKTKNLIFFAEMSEYDEIFYHYQCLDFLERIVKPHWKDNHFDASIDDGLDVIYREKMKGFIYHPTIFYCDKAVYPYKNGSILSNLRWHRSIITSLPFSLNCNENQEEIAIALNLDSDAFPYIAMISCKSDNCSIFLAADDEKNRYDPQIKDRLKP